MCPDLQRCTIHDNVEFHVVSCTVCGVLYLCVDGSLQDLASGYMSGKLLQKLEAVHFMLQHHTSEHFGFLEEHTRNRTIFYNTLSKLLFMEDTPSNFKSFVAPLQQVSSCFSQI